MRHLTYIIQMDKTMKTFKKIKLKDSKYDYLFIATESDTTVIEAVPIIEKINQNAKILFDMFLKQGNNSRRFIEYNYINNEKIDINKFNIVNDVPDDIYSTTKSFFKKNISLLDNGAFTDKFKLAFKSQL